MYRVASFDIGKKNFSFSIEEYDAGVVERVVKVAKTRRYREDGTPTPEFLECLNKVVGAGRLVCFRNKDLTVGCKDKKYIEPELFQNMYDYLDSLVAEWDLCNVFVVEMQMSFGKRYNTMALKLGQHCQSYFHFRYGRFKEVVEFPAYHKTQVLGAEKVRSVTKRGKVSYKALDKPARKKWAVEMAISFLVDRDDFVHLAELESSRKKDDMADCLLQSIAFFYLRAVDGAV